MIGAKIYLIDNEIATKIMYPLTETFVLTVETKMIHSPLSLKTKNARRSGCPFTTLLIISNDRVDQIIQ